MTLAEALNVRSDLNRRLMELRERIISNAKYQEGDSPSEDPNELLEQFESVAVEYMNMVTRINKTNNAIKLGDGKDMVDALAERDMLKLSHRTYRSLASEATPVQDRYSKKEIKFVSAVKVSEIQSMADNVAKQLRELDTLIQQANWNNDLI
jgi:hypothetical protein|tara:strand:+ start:3960 stop:4415 length:456 start_codon:yes stop_codon:yes gene_type:complete